MRYIEEDWLRKPPSATPRSIPRVEPRQFLRGTKPKILSTDWLLQRCAWVETRLTLRPGMPGTKKLLDRYADRLVCVRYLYDEAAGVRLKTVELVVEKTPWTGKPRHPRRQDHDMVAVQIAWDELVLRAAVKEAGGIWRARQRVWELDWKTVRTLKIQDRVIAAESAQQQASGKHIAVDI